MQFAYLKLKSSKDRPLLFSCIFEANKLENIFYIYPCMTLQESHLCCYVTDTCQTMIWLLSLVDWPRVVTDIKSPPCSSSAVSSLSPNRKSTYPSPPDNTNSIASVTVFSGLDLAWNPLGLVDLAEGVAG